MTIRQDANTLPIATAGEWARGPKTRTIQIIAGTNAAAPLVRKPIPIPMFRFASSIISAFSDLNNLGSTD